MKRRILVLMVGVCSALLMISCGGSSSGLALPPSRLPDRVMITQGSTSASTNGSILIVDGYNDTVPRLPPLAAGTEPGTIAISPTLNVLTTFDAGGNSVYAVDTTTEKSIGSVHLNCQNSPPLPCLLPYSSFIVPTSAPIGYAAVPGAFTEGFSYVGAVVQMNFTNSAITGTIAVPNAASLISNSAGSQILVFSSDSNSVTVISPGNAVPPVDLSCLSNTPNAVCTIVPGFDHPVYGIVSGTTAYILNCGPQCGGVQASVAVFDLTTLTITNLIPVEAATWALLNGSTLYVVGTPPTNNACTGETTAATTCGRLDIVDVGSGTVTTSGIVVTDGYHDKMDLNVVGQLFIGSKDCTNIGNFNDPAGEVRGCLSIVNISDNSVFIPPNTGNVDGLQGFITRPIEYVAEDGNLYVYDVNGDYLLIDVFLTNGIVPTVGYVGDVKAVDIF